MTRARAYLPALPSRSHGEEIAAALFVAAMETAAKKRFDKDRTTAQPRRR